MATSPQAAPRRGAGTTTPAAGWSRRSSWILGLACTVQFMVVLDICVVNVALPSIREDLHFTSARLQWVANAYALAFGGFLLLGGRLADLYGRRRTTLTGLVVFSAFSLLGGLAHTPVLLVAARAGQGLGAAVLAPAALTILTTAFPPGSMRTRALAVLGAVTSVGGAAGNLAGGVLTQALSWRWILLVNVPIGIAAALLTVRCLSADDRGKQLKPLDVRGAVSVTVGLTALTYGVSQADSGGWTDVLTVGSLITALFALTVFLLVEARIAPHPLIPLRLFRSRGISVGNTVVLLAGAVFQIPMWYFLTLYLQDVLGYGALQTGLAFLPHTLMGIALGLYVTPRLMKRFQHRILIVAGTLLTAAGFVWQSRTTPDSGYVQGVLGPAVVFCAGSAFFMTPITSVVTSGVTERDAGAASGLMNTAKQVGGALGLAVLIALAEPNASRPGMDYETGFLSMAAILLAISALAFALPRQRDSETASVPDA